MGVGDDDGSTLNNNNYGIQLNGQTMAIHIRGALTGQTLSAKQCVAMVHMYLELRGWMKGCDASGKMSGDQVAGMIAKHPKFGRPQKVLMLRCKLRRWS